MSKRTKTFQKIFEECSDTISEERTKKKGKKIPAMMEDTFVSTAGEIYNTAKNKYFDRTILFTKWMFANCVQSTDGNFCLLHLDKGEDKNWKKIEYWYKYWKEKINT